jgi:glycosyltransferase involved in cell wall biosynthesis
MDQVTAPSIICLLPARNAAHLLPDWFESVGRFADAVVALDDGSTDETGELLRAHPLVRTVLANRRREGYAGWHDGANRNRLLGAAGELDPTWVMFLDADERLDADDAAVLRAFVGGEAIPGCAYGFPVFRMFENETYDPDYEWVFRLFTYQPGQRLPHARIDFTPVPLSMRTRVQTTVRIKHYGEVGVAGRETRVAKYRETDPGGEFRHYYEHLQEPTLGPYPTWHPRPDDLPVLRVRREWAEPAAPVLPDDAARPARQLGRQDQMVVCVLPARNCSELLPDWFESVGRFADAVVALDDGSTDDTADVLERHPLVKTLLRHPRRLGVEGWDDGANRNELLQAAGDLDPDWIIGIDADERISPDDAAALRRFIDEEAVPGCAYGFPVYRMIGDGDHFDRRENWAFRLFAYQPGDVLSAEKLHGVPVPTSIPGSKWLRTSIRIQHLGGLTDDARRARREKYEVLDPEHRWELDYSYADAPLQEIQPWPARQKDEPVVIGPHDAEDWLDFRLAELDLEGPVLSVVVICGASDYEEMLEVVDATLAQESDSPIEVVAVGLGADVAEDVAEARPGVTVIEVDPDASPGAARNAGLRVARGDYVLFLDGPVDLAPGALAELIAIHDRGYSMVAGTADNGTRSAAGWATYFLDHAASLPGGTDGDLVVAPSRCSFAREPLIDLGGFAERTGPGVETLAADRLLRRGHRATRTALVRISHVSGSATQYGLLRERFDLGRAIGQDVRAARVATVRSRLSDVVRAGGRRYAAARRDVRDAPPDVAVAYRRVLPLVVGGLVATGAGACWEQLHDLPQAIAARRRESR